MSARPLRVSQVSQMSVSLVSPMRGGGRGDVDTGPPDPQERQAAASDAHAADVGVCRLCGRRAVDVRVSCDRLAARPGQRRSCAPWTCESRVSCVSRRRAPRRDSLKMSICDSLVRGPAAGHRGLMHASSRPSDDAREQGWGRLVIPAAGGLLAPRLQQASSLALARQR